MPEQTITRKHSYGIWNIERYLTTQLECAPSDLNDYDLERLTEDIRAELAGFLPSPITLEGGEFRGTEPNGTHPRELIMDALEYFTRFELFTTLYRHDYSVDEVEATRSVMGVANEWVQDRRWTVQLDSRQTPYQWLHAQVGGTRPDVRPLRQRLTVRLTDCEPQRVVGVAYCVR
jgi:hypothetical protein